ncbi:MAG: hypothetical protein KA354_04155 [Phycisphaerae bacterium]|nr:hypothetical protein [Phycisphaerae bacterium]
MDEQSIAAGVALSRWFGNEVRRVYATLGESDEGRDRRHLVEWIERRGGRVSVRELTHGLRPYRGQSGAARAVLDGLVKAGLGRWIHPAPEPGGGRPSPRFELIGVTPVTKTPVDAIAVRGFGSGDTGDSAGDVSFDDPADQRGETVEEAVLSCSATDDDWGEL